MTRNFRGKDYRCHKCKATELKLWREYNTFLNHQTLLCAACASPKDQPFVFTSTSRYDRGDFCDQISDVPEHGAMVPAVPTEEGDTFWGYTSVPQADVAWWYERPTHKDPALDVLAERNINRKLRRENAFYAKERYDQIMARKG